MGTPGILYLAAALVAAVGVAHSWLGERYLLSRLFRRSELPPLFGGTVFTRQTLRFAWHVTSMAWLGLAGILVVVAQGPGHERSMLWVVAGTFGVHFAIALVASRGRHLSWIAFLAIAVLVGLAAGA